MGDKSKHNAPDWESAKGRFSTLVDPVEDEHLVQIEDHPERDIDERRNLGWDEGLHPPILNLGRLHIVTISYIQKISYITPSNIEPGQAAYQEGGDDGDEHQSKPFLATSATSSLSYLIS